MPLEASPDKALTLFELNQLVGEVINIDMPGPYWVEAEVSEMREVRGHCYLELVQKDEWSNTPVARAQAKCWANVWSKMKPKFERITGQRLHTGMKLMLCVRPNFHEAYGFAWIVSAINPEFTMGDLARRRREIINRLREEGVLELQKELSLPMFAQRIAVISSAGAAGYDDFCNQLDDNGRSLHFTTCLFAATMQGEAVEQSVIHALNEINKVADQFDAVVIIRGGGATSDLSGFDTLPLAENVANFPLPIITGIGHNRDESILDIVAHTSVKTPTAAAALLIDNLADTADRIEEASASIARMAKAKLEGERLHLNALATSLVSTPPLTLMQCRNYIGQLAQRLSASAATFTGNQRDTIAQLAMKINMLTPQTLRNHRHALDLLGKRLEAVDPAILLRRGYSITTKDGKIVRDASMLCPGDRVETRVEHGTFKSVVTDKD